MTTLDDLIAIDVHTQANAGATAATSLPPALVEAAARRFRGEPTRPTAP